MEQSKYKNKTYKKSTFREYAEAFAIALLLALFIRTFMIEAFKIPSVSMNPTLLVGDHLLVNKFIYGIKIPFIDRYIVRFKKPKRGEVVVFRFPRDEKKDYIKRIIGIPGDKIEIKRGELYINGKKIKENYDGKYIDRDRYSRTNRYIEYLNGHEHHILGQDNTDYNFESITVPENSIFLMGDNRDNSEDSRSWGFASQNKIKGKALIIYWSWPNWKRFLNVIK